MTVTLAMNAFNDIYIDGAGNMAVSTDINAIKEACAQAIKALRGEMFYAADRGMPHFEVTFTGSPNVLQFEAAARTEIMRIEGVTEIPEFNAQVINNVMTYTAVIDTIFGTGNVSG